LGRLEKENVPRLVALSGQGPDNWDSCQVFANEQIQVECGHTRAIQTGQDDVKTFSRRLFRDRKGSKNGAVQSKNESEAER